MTGPEHYQEAERLIDAVVSADSPFPALRNDELLAAAQAHATLALAAATALSQTDNDERMVGMHEADYLAWDKVAGVSPLAVDHGD